MIHSKSLIGWCVKYYHSLRTKIVPDVRFINGRKSSLKLLFQRWEVRDQTVLESFLEAIPKSFEWVQLRQFRLKVPDVKLVSTQATELSLTGRVALSTDMLPEIAAVKVSWRVQGPDQLLAKLLFESSNSLIPWRVSSISYVQQ